jgi:poly-beta-1,6-N-acetyl-D-glucosamine synthase
VVAVIPAHNEEAQLAATLESVLGQTRVPDRVLVVADNCTDRTVEIARTKGVEVIETVDNAARKAGALNQGWAVISGQLEDDDRILFLDADTRLSETFVENTLRHLDADPGLAAVCGCFSGRPEIGGLVTRLLSLLQRMEYERYRRQVARKRGATRILTGTATMFAFGPLWELAEDRGHLYDTTSIVEDFELTLALRYRGRRYRSPKDCSVSTEVMPTVAKLWHQRVRWFRGTLDALRKYGLSRVTARDYLGQALLVASVGMRLMFVAVLALTVALAGNIHFQALWLAAAGFVALERAISVRPLGWWAMVTAALLFVEFVYSVFAESYFVRSLWLHLRNRQAVWHAT